MFGGMVVAAPQLAILTEKIGKGVRYDVNISPELAQAAKIISHLRDEGFKVSQYLRQEVLFDELSPLSKDLPKAEILQAAIKRMGVDNVQAALFESADADSRETGQFAQGKAVGNQRGEHDVPSRGKQGVRKQLREKEARGRRTLSAVRPPSFRYWS